MHFFEFYLNSVLKVIVYHLFTLMLFQTYSIWLSAAEKKTDLISQNIFFYVPQKKESHTII